MATDNNQNFVPIENVVDFLSNALPFNILAPEIIHALARKCLVDFYPKGTRIFEQNSTRVDYFYLIQRGGVKSFLCTNDDEETAKLVDFRGEGEYFGALPIIQNTTANLNVETVEDTFCFLIAKNDFRKILEDHKEVSQYFLRTMSAKLVKGVYAELRQQKAVPKAEGALHLFSAPVADIAKGKLHTAPLNATVQEVACLMSDYCIGSLLIRDEAGAIVGIVTDKDIRSKVVAKGLDYHAKVSEIMSSPVQTISHLAVGFDALLKMMKDRVHHLAIEKGGQMYGIITTHDIMVHQGTSPLYLFREIISLQDIEGLYALSKKVAFVIRPLIEEGAKANNITRMMTVLNDHILTKLLTLLQEQMGPAPVPFCWLLVGSEGRREQTFKTDQDNAIIYAQSDDPALTEESERYFEAFAKQAINHLVQCGYPLCPGDIMASNLKWRQPYPVWEGYFAKWCGTPNPQEVLNSTIFFDFRSGYGDATLADTLRKRLNEIIKREGIFLLYLARNCLSSKPPLSFFKNFIVEKDGEHKNTFDLKSKAIVFLVDFARLMALKYGVNEVNTLDRLMALNQQYMSSGLRDETIEAYEFLMHVRLVHQLRMLENGEEPNNYINPKDLSDLERQTLKEAFLVITRLQDVIRQEFQITDL